MEKINLHIFFCYFTPAEAREISFIYINGTNSFDDYSKKWFFDGIKKTHADIKKALENDEFTKEKFLKNGEDKINPSEKAFFWGEMSGVEIEELIRRLNYTKVYSSKIAQRIRETFAYYMHDTVWITKYHNSSPLLEKLHESVMEEYSKGKQSLLMGYSAGSLITYEYLLRRVRYFPIERYKNNLPEEIKKQLPNLDFKNTCIAALEKSKLAVISPSGELFSNDNIDFINKNYPNLNDYTEKYCLPDDAIKGVIDFASSFSLFYTEIMNLEKSISLNSKMLYVYMIENEKFWLTINWSNDPFSYPSGEPMTIESAKKFLQMEIKPNGGYFYSKFDKKSRSMFLFAHDSYWTNSKRFAKNIVKAYREGFCKYYSEK